MYEDDEEEEDDEAGQVKLETAIGRIKGKSTEFRYRVTNGLEYPILLTTPLSRFEEGVLRAAPSKMYVFVDPMGILQITKRLWILPDSVDIAYPEVPFVTELLPGKTFEERIELSLPVPVEIPYRLEPEEMDEKREEIVAVAGGIAFSIGYLVEEKKALRRGAASRESGASLTIGYGTAAVHQRILQGATLEVGVPVKDFVR